MESRLWIDRKTPQLVSEVIERKTSATKGGGSSSGRGTSYGDSKTLNDVDLRLPRRDAFLWTGIILQHTNCGQDRQALRIYDKMREYRVTRSSSTFVAALKACRNLQDLERAKQIHAEVVQNGMESDVYVGTTLVDVYAKCSRLADARHVFEKMPHRNVVSWNAIIAGYAQAHEGEVALDLYRQMQQEGLMPNERTFVGALRACISLEGGKDGDGKSLKQECLEQVRALHSDIVRIGCESNPFVGNLLVDVYAKCGSLTDAMHVFETLPYRNVVSWTSMILGHVQMEEGEVALQLYGYMQQQGVLPDDRAFVGALKACSIIVSLEEGNKDTAILVKRRCLEHVRAIHQDIMKGQLESDVFVGTTLVDAYAKCGSLVAARQVFEAMPRRNVVCWTAMILGYAQMEEGEEALQLYARMQLESVTPDSLAFIGALKACGVVASLEKGKEIHLQMTRVGCTHTDLLVPNTLIDMYGKCGSMVDAQLVFDALPKRDIVTWSALIAGYAHQGETQLVFDLFQKMRQEGVQPNSITFLSVLTACSHGGLVDKGQEYFEAMSRDYGVAPTTEHYISMVDLLGRAGQVDKAMEMVKMMPCQPDSALWKTILGACRKWRKLELGREAFEHAVRLDKQDAAVYVLMSNIYAAAQMWKEVKEIHEKRVKAQAWKQPGQSWWTDLGGTVHTFVVGDRQHADSGDIHAKLQYLIIEMKKQGYVPHLNSVLRDIPDDEKENALSEHSEKLAITYALLKTPAGTTIRVVKNLRVCEDCHTAIAIISKMEQRTIICRDASRFHVYKDGKCSCGDFW